MLNKVEVRTKRGNVLTLPLYEDNGGYQIVDIDGLDPVDATLVSSSYANIDGEQYQSARRSARDITFTIEYDPNYTTNNITSLRNNLYSFFMPKTEVSMRFYLSSGVYLDITGYVEKFETPLFSSDPTVDIIVRCFQPDFVDPRIITLTGNTVSDATVREIEYPGTVESGVILTLRPQREVVAFAIYSTGEDNLLHQFDFTGTLLAADVLVISSLRGAKGITLTRDNVARSYLYGRSPQSSWIELGPGLNNFRVYASGDPVPYELEYVIRYGGL